MINQNFRTPPAIIALLLQVSAVLSVLFFAWALSIKLSLAAFAGSCGLMAAYLSYAIKLPRWWLVIQGSFVPVLIAALALKMEPIIFLVAFLVTALVYWNVLSTRVPLYLSSKAVWRALAQLLPPPDTKNNFKFIDIGSGLGGVLTHLAKIRPDGAYLGVESAPLPFVWSWLRLRSGNRRQCRVCWGDYWDCDLSAYDVVYAYLSPAPMEKLWQKARAEMKPGSVFISSTFSVPGQTPDEAVEIDDLHHSTLLVWRM